MYIELGPFKVKQFYLALTAFNLRPAVVMDAGLELIKLLVTHGAELGARDGLGKSCCDLAKLYRRQQATDYFDKVHEFRQEQAKAAQALANTPPQSGQRD